MREILQGSLGNLTREDNYEPCERDCASVVSDFGPSQNRSRREDRRFSQILSSDQNNRQEPDPRDRLRYSSLVSEVRKMEIGLIFCCPSTSCPVQLRARSPADWSRSRPTWPAYRTPSTAPSTPTIPTPSSGSGGSWRREARL